MANEQKSVSEMIDEFFEEAIREYRGTIEFYEDAKGEYRWRIIARNTNIMADSGEGYKKKKDCIEALKSVRWYLNGNSEVKESW